MHGNKLRLFFFGQGIPPYSYYQCRVSDIAAVGTSFNVFSYEAVLGRASNHRGRVFRESMYKAEQLFTRLTIAKPRIHNLPVLSGYATCYATDTGKNYPLTYILFTFKILNILSFLNFK